MSRFSEGRAAGGLIDFADMITGAERLLRTDPAVRQGDGLQAPCALSSSGVSKPTCLQTGMLQRTVAFEAVRSAGREVVIRE